MYIYAFHTHVSTAYIKMVHRDIKPENIVLGDKDGSIVQLIDFGMTVRSGAHIEKLCGSTPYTPPEICNASEEVDIIVEPSWDVWSVGIVLFCMLTGKLLWKKATQDNKAFCRFHQWQRLGVKPPSVWRDFDFCMLKLFSKLLAIKPTDRCPIMEALSL